MCISIYFLNCKIYTFWETLYFEMNYNQNFKIFGFWQALYFEMMYDQLLNLIFLLIESRADKP